MEVLGECAVIRRQNYSEEVRGAGAHPLLALLSLESGGHISNREIWARTGITPSEDALYQAVRRLAAKGIEIDNERGKGYRLASPPSSVDLVTFLDRGTRALSARSRDDAVVALSLWRAELPKRVGEAPVFTEALGLRASLERLANTRPKRVLVIEDMAGTQIKRRLLDRYPGEIEVVVLESVDLFYKALDGQSARGVDGFDLVLVDFHLTQGDEAFQGYDVAARLRDRDEAVPVVGMSYQRSNRYSDTSVMLMYDLWDFVPKSSASGGESLDSVVSYALGVLELTPEMKVEHYVRRIGMLREMAAAELRSKGATPARQRQMEADGRMLQDSARNRDLETLRAGCRRFARDWLPPA